MVGALLGVTPEYTNYPPSIPICLPNTVSFVFWFCFSWLSALRGCARVFLWPQRFARSVPFWVLVRPLPLWEGFAFFLWRSALALIGGGSDEVVLRTLCVGVRVFVI